MKTNQSIHPYTPKIPKSPKSMFSKIVPNHPTCLQNPPEPLNKQTNFKEHLKKCRQNLICFLKIFPSLLCPDGLAMVTLIKSKTNLRALLS